MSLELIKENLVETFQIIPEEIEEAWRIRFNNRWVRLKSGKDVWNKRQHAKSAFKNHLDYYYRWNHSKNTYQMFGVDLCNVTGKYGRFSNEVKNKLVDMLVEDGVLEFIKLI